MIEPTTPDEDEAFNELERMSRVRQEVIKSLPFKTKQEIYDELRDNVIEEIAQHIEKMKVFGKDTVDSFAIYIRGMKK